jgi:nickel-dependent lactate racemase
MAEIPLITKTVIGELKERGAKPFIVPAMGSHGGATAEGQKEVLARLGVTEASAGCPIVSSMEVVEVGTLDDGMAALIDKNAFEADGIVFINRIPCTEQSQVPAGTRRAGRYVGPQRSSAPSAIRYHR